MLPEDFEQKLYRFQLRNGSSILVRKVLPEDKKRLEEGFRHFSDQSRYKRFFSPIKSLSKTQLNYLTDINYDTHMAWGAIMENAPDMGIGIARFIRSEEQPDCAEAAISVIDECHGLGVGTILFAALSLSAHQRGITTFQSYMLQQNQNLMASIKRLNSTVRFQKEGVFAVTTPVYFLGSDFPVTTTGKTLECRMLELLHQARV